MAKTIPTNTMPAHGLKVTQASDINDGDIHLDVDAVVIGSGAGGAISAYELAKAGKKVVVLEAGRYVPSEKFTEMMAVSMDAMYADHGGQSNSAGDIAVLQGTCVGGSTVVNAALCFRTPDYYLDLWARDYGLTNLTPEVLLPYFEKVEANLSIETNKSYETSAGAELLRTGMKKLSLPDSSAKRNIRDCVMTGFCFAGCKSDRKQSMLVTYLPWAAAYGAEIYADTRATRILAKNGKASGVEAQVVDPDTKEIKASVRINAPIVVAAAGPIQTPLLLQRSNLANSSGQVGKNFACHPTLSITGMFDDNVDNFHGATHSLYMDKYTMPEEGGYLLLDAVQDPTEASFQAEPGTGEPYMAYMSRYRNAVRLITLIHDQNVGEVNWNNGAKEIKYFVDDADFEIMKAGLKTNARILFAAGANKLHIPSSQPLSIDSENDIDSVIGGLKNEPARYRYTSFHPQGTCRMGADPAKTVVSPTGETHDVHNLYVVDASLLPTSIGYNPSETVYALAHYINDHINRVHS
ncbi:GMC family oxidoreductase [Marinobacter salinexigens]|uniref:GMC family oxidoreductase n=1 Tax=Marinobacter salinexigens TaxID=2919747 RepID=A0A5B0V8D6_9GAMM|nr:GMC family oxidoreductase [Marinobacter salinexigens]KAA1170850.1 GMC family oxidoreductase [Marinobacter salinexigens]